MNRLHGILQFVCYSAQIKMYLSDYSILELFGRFTTVFIVCSSYMTVLLQFVQQYTIVHLSKFLSGCERFQFFSTIRVLLS